MRGGSADITSATQEMPKYSPKEMNNLKITKIYKTSPNGLVTNKIFTNYCRIAALVR